MSVRTRNLTERFRGVFDEIGQGAAERDRHRIHPHAQISALRDAGFLTVTVPERFGGSGATLPDLFDLLAELARRDSNIAQLLRSHFSFIDRAIHTSDEARRERDLCLVAGGALHGNATFEKGSAAVGTYGTTLTRDDRGFRLDGTKYYSTGTLYADLVSVAADHGGASVGVLVRTDAPGVARIDDWNGFGQRVTGSGTTIFDEVRVAEADVTVRGTEAPGHGGAFVQLVLLAAAAGIARAIVDDAVAYVRARTRTYSHASAHSARRDPLVQQIIGRLSAHAYAADAALASASASLARSSEAILSGADDGERADAVAAADLSVARAQQVILPTVLASATELFEVGGASAVDQDLGLDRHWRNVRTLANHNPLAYKTRMVGEHLLEGTPVASWWGNGEGAA